MIEPDHSRLSIVRQCQLVSIARSSHYYAGKGESPLNLALMRLIDEQYLRTPWYGSRQMARHLRRQGYRVGRKRIRRLMRQMGLMAIYRKPRTSKPNPAHRIYPYLLRDLRIDQPNHVWCADVTYIPMRRGLPGGDHGLGDAYGALLAPVEHPGQRLLCRGPAGGVGQVRQPGGFQHGPGMPIHQRGFHLGGEKQAGVRISMDGKGRWRDNVFVERLWRSVKYEEVYLNAYASVPEARAGIGRYLDFYNAVRPHSALGGRTPDQIYFQKPLLAAA